jgi:hypothetical protein
VIGPRFFTAILGFKGRALGAARNRYSEVEAATAINAVDEIRAGRC